MDSLHKGPIMRKVCPSHDIIMKYIFGVLHISVVLYKPFIFYGIKISGLFQYISGLMQERNNSIANALEFHLSCINPSISKASDISHIFTWCCSCWCVWGIGWSGGRINIKMSSYQYRKSHCGDKTIFRPSYLHNEISYTDKMTSLYWIRALIACLVRNWLEKP